MSKIVGDKSLNVDSIRRGVVIDHIKAGKAMEIYKSLRLDDLDCCVAVIKNVKSKKQGKKDIIKIEDRIDIDLDALGYIDPNLTVNIIENDVVTEKKNIKLPKKIKNIVKCKNPRCITSIEQELPHIFTLVDAEKRIYRCIYCEQQSK